MKKRIDFISHMFDQISEKYDRTNRILSFGNDIRWRKKVASFLPDHDRLSILDLATGTADQIITFFKASKKIKQVIGLDPSNKMLEIGRKKIEKSDYANRVSLVEGDALYLPFSENSFDVVSVSFGIRNFSDPEKGLQEMHRVLKKGGRSLILEFSLPKNRLIKKGALFYLNHLLPIIGKRVTSNSFAYDYLSRTIQTFPYGKEFVQMMEKAGFRNCKEKKLSLGMVTIYIGEK